MRRARYWYPFQVDNQSQRTSHRSSISIPRRELSAASPLILRKYTKNMKMIGHGSKVNVSPMHLIHPYHVTTNAGKESSFCISVTGSGTTTIGSPADDLGLENTSGTGSMWRFDGSQIMKEKKQYCGCYPITLSSGRPLNPFASNYQGIRRHRQSSLSIRFMYGLRWAHMPSTRHMTADPIASRKCGVM